MLVITPGGDKCAHAADVKEFGFWELKSRARDKNCPRDCGPEANKVWKLAFMRAICCVLVPEFKLKPGRQSDQNTAGPGDMATE